MSAPTGAPSCLTLSQATMRRCALAAVSTAFLYVPVLTASLNFQGACQCASISRAAGFCAVRSLSQVQTVFASAVASSFYYCGRHSAEQRHRGTRGWGHEAMGGGGV